jgi:ATP-dependent Lhr-like helicase
MNDYGFELLSDLEIPLNEENIALIFSKENLIQDVTASINASEMASRKFRSIAVVSGLVIQTQPGNRKTTKSLQSSSGLIFRVLNDYEPTNLLLKQAYNEVFDYELEKVRLEAAFKRISESKIILKRAKNFTPLSFPLKVDSLRGTMSNEDLSKRIERIQKQALK